MSRANTLSLQFAHNIQLLDFLVQFITSRLSSKFFSVDNLLILQKLFAYPKEKSKELFQLFYHAPIPPETKSILKDAPEIRIAIISLMSDTIFRPKTTCYAALTCIIIPDYPALNYWIDAHGKSQTFNDCILHNIDISDMSLNDFNRFNRPTFEQVTLSAPQIIALSYPSNYSNIILSNSNPTDIQSFILFYLQNSHFNLTEQMKQVIMSHTLQLSPETHSIFLSPNVMQTILLTANLFAIQLILQAYPNAYTCSAFNSSVFAQLKQIMPFNKMNAAQDVWYTKLLQHYYSHEIIMNKFLKTITIHHDGRKQLPLEGELDTTTKNRNGSSLFLQSMMNRYLNHQDQKALLCIQQFIKHYSTAALRSDDHDSKILCAMGKYITSKTSEHIYQGTLSANRTKTLRELFNIIDKESMLAQDKSDACRDILESMFPAKASSSSALFAINHRSSLKTAIEAVLLPRRSPAAQAMSAPAVIFK